MKQSKLQFFIHKLTGVFIADVHMRPTAFFLASRPDSWKHKDVFCLLWCHSVRPYQPPCLSVFLQEEKGISCGLVELDFLKCSVGFPFMRAQTKVALPLHTCAQRCTIGTSFWLKQAHFSPHSIISQ